MSEKKQLGHLKNIMMDIDAPMKFGPFDMNFNALSLLIGKNGSGKSLIMKINWCFGMVASYHIINKTLGGSIDMIKETKFIFDKSFDEQNFNGIIAVEYENGKLTIQFDKGEVLLSELNSTVDIAPSKPSLYMSSSTRLFDSFYKYMQFKKALSITGNITNFKAEELDKLLNMYKLYDLMFIEAMLLGMHHYVMKEETKKSLKESFEIPYEFDEFIVDTDACVIYSHIRATGEKRSLTTFSAGEQSLINMSLAPNF
jgi:hypothetical protein